MTQVGSNQAPECEPPPGIMIMIEKISRVAALWGFKMGLEKMLEFEKTFRTLNTAVMNSSVKTSWAIERSSFLKSSDPYHAFYQKKRDQYLAQYQDGTLDIQVPAANDLVPPPDWDHPPPFKGFSVPAGITLTELGIIKFTAQFVARFGVNFWLVLKDVVGLNPRFTFMRRTDSKNSFYNGLVVVYQRVLRPRNVYPAYPVLEAFFHYLQLEKLDERLIDLHAFVGGLDWFTHMDDADFSATMPPPQPFSIMMMHPDMPPLTSQLAQNQAHQDDIQPDTSSATRQPDLVPPPPLRPRCPTSTFPARITLKDLGILKLTAQFVARYGKRFSRALMMRSVRNPQFEFMFFRRDLRPQYQLMEPSEIMFHIFSVLVDAYSSILMPSKTLKKNDASLATVLECFRLRLQLEKLEEGMETAMIDLHAFVAGVDYFAHMDDANYSAIMTPPERLSVMMNRPTHMHPGVLVLLPLRLQLSDYHDSRNQFSLLAETFPPRITLEEQSWYGIIKLTSQFLSRYGMSFHLALMSRVSMDPRFEFLKHTSSRRYVCYGFIDVYSRVLKPSKKVKKSDDCTAIALEVFFHCLQLEKLKEGGETSVIDLHAFMSGVDCFAYMDNADYSAIMPRPQRLSVMMKWRPPHRAQNQDGAHKDDIQVPDAPDTHECVGDAQPDLEPPPPLGKPSLRPRVFVWSIYPWVTQKELIIIKLTALFVARYGMLFCRDLMKKVVMKPQFELFKFMEPTDRRFGFYNVVVNAYSKVLKASYDAYTETVLEEYFHWLQWEELEQGVTMARLDLHAFVEGVDLFAQMEDANYSDIMGDNLPRMLRWRMFYDQYESPSTGMMQHAPTMPGMSSRPPEEPVPKRRKFDESARVQEDQFLAPGSPKIRVSVPTINGRQVIEITVKSLSENVASLKEKLAGVVQMPANKLKLRGKAGLLEDKSLAHNSVGAGDILTLSWRMSRWTS